MARRLKSLRVDLVGATPEQIAEALLRVDRTKAAIVAALVVREVGPEVLEAARSDGGEAVARAVGARLVASLLEGGP